MNNQELRATLSIALLYIVRMLGLFMVLPVLPLLIDEVALATPFLIGIALGIYGLSQALLQIPMGLLSDKIGRKPVIFLGLMIFVSGSLLAGFADNIYGIIAGRFLQGCGAISSTLLALLADVTRVDNRTKAMAIVGISIGASFAISLVLGPWLNHLYGIEGIFIGTATAGVLALTILLVFVPTPKLKLHPSASKDVLVKMRELALDPSLARLTFGVFSLHFLLMSSFLAFPKLMQGTGEIANSEHHLVYLYILIATFVLMGPFMRLADKKGRAKGLMLTMVGFFILSALILSEFRSYATVISAMILFFMAFNLLEVILPALVSKVSPAGARGAAMGVYSSAQFAGAFMGGAIGGFILSKGSITHLMYVNAVLCGVWLIVGSGLPNLGNIKSMTFSLGESDDATANHLLDAVLSVQGVMEAVHVANEALIYLKVDIDLLDKDALDSLQEIQYNKIAQVAH